MVAARPPSRPRLPRRAGLLDQPLPHLRKSCPDAPSVRLAPSLRRCFRLRPARVRADRLSADERGDVVEEHFGERVADPYRWLENDVREDPRVRAWVTAQNEVTDAYLATLPGRDAFRARMTQLYDYERFGTAGEGGQPLFLHPQRRPPEPVGPLRPRGAERRAAAADRSQHLVGRRRHRARRMGSVGGRPPPALFGPGRRHRLAHRARARRRHRPADAGRGPLGQILEPRLGQGRLGLLLFALPRAGRRASSSSRPTRTSRSISTASARRRARTGWSMRRRTGRALGHTAEVSEDGRWLIVYSLRRHRRPLRDQPDRPHPAGRGAAPAGHRVRE